MIQSTCILVAMATKFLILQARWKCCYCRERKYLHTGCETL